MDTSGWEWEVSPKSRRGSSSKIHNPKAGGIVCGMRNHRRESKEFDDRWEPKNDVGLTCQRVGHVKVFSLRLPEWPGPVDLRKGFRS